MRTRPASAAPGYAARRRSELQDVDSPGYWLITPEDLAAQIVGVINTPWGLDISDITVRATGEDFVQ